MSWELSSLEEEGRENQTYPNLSEGLSHGDETSAYSSERLPPWPGLYYSEYAFNVRREELNVPKFVRRLSPGRRDIGVIYITLSAVARTISKSTCFISREESNVPEFIRRLSPRWTHILMLFCTAVVARAELIRGLGPWRGDVCAGDGNGDGGGEEEEGDEGKEFEVHHFVGVWC